MRPRNTKKILIVLTAAILYIALLFVIAFVASIIYLLIISVQQSRTFEIACSEKGGVVIHDAAICVKTDSIIKLEIK